MAPRQAACLIDLRELLRLSLGLRVSLCYLQIGAEAGGQAGATLGASMSGALGELEGRACGSKSGAMAGAKAASWAAAKLSSSTAIARAKADGMTGDDEDDDPSETLPA